MEDDNTPPLAQPADSAPSDSSPNDAKCGDDGIEHRLAMLVGEAWQRRIDLAIRPLVELRRHVHVKFADKDVKVKKVLANLPNRVSEVCDRMFPVNFVSQSYAEIDTVVATTLPEELAKARNIDKLKHTLRKAIGEFADSAQGVLAKGTDEGFQSSLEDWQSQMLGMFAVTKDSEEAEEGCEEQCAQMRKRGDRRVGGRRAKARKERRGQHGKRGGAGTSEDSLTGTATSTDGNTTVT